MNLSKETYFTPEINMKYMSASQFKSFMQCEANALAECKGEVIREKSVSLLVGSYVDAHFEGSMRDFTDNNPEIFKADRCSLKSEYVYAQSIIARIERDPLMMKYLAGSKQVIMENTINGIPFKSKVDSFHPGKCIVDLKVMKDLEDMWKDGSKVPFIEAWGYDIQGAIYQAVEGNKLPFYIAAATKEKPEPNIEMFLVNQRRLDYCMDMIKANLDNIISVKNGDIEPTRCEKCSYCKRTKVLKNIIDYESLKVEW